MENIAKRPHAWGKHLFFALLLSLCLIWVAADGLFHLHPWRNTVTVTVPDLHGTLFREGDTVDERLFRLTVSYVYHPHSPPRTILSQDPPPHAGRKVIPNEAPCPLEIVVSMGEHTVIIPDTVGMDARDAAILLSGRGLTVTVSPVTLWGTSARQAETDQVLSSSPAAGQTVSADTPVTLFAARPVRDESLRCPHVIGLPLADALKQIKDAGFRASYVYKSSLSDSGFETNLRPSDIRGGTVLWQDRVPDSWLPPDTEINLTVDPRAPFPSSEPMKENTERTKEDPWNTDKTASSSRSRADSTPFGWTRDKIPWRAKRWSAAPVEISDMKG